MASDALSWPRVMPMARRVADSRVRSITDRDSVFATPIKATSTATAISPTMSIIMESIICAQVTRSAIGPDTAASALFDNADWMPSYRSFTDVPDWSVSAFTSSMCVVVSRSPLAKCRSSTNPTAP